MNYNWKKLDSRGQKDTGSADMFHLEHLGMKAICVIHYFPQFENDTKEKVELTILLQQPKDKWTEGFISSIFHDMEDIIKDHEAVKFRFLNKLEYINCKIIYLDNIDGIQLGFVGDYNFID